MYGQGKHDGAIIGIISKGNDVIDFNEACVSIALYSFQSSQCIQIIILILIHINLADNIC